MRAGNGTGVTVRVPRPALGPARSRTGFPVHDGTGTGDLALPRTPPCAVISELQLEAWLRSLPVQRSLNAARRAQLLAMLRGGRSTRVLEW